MNDNELFRAIRTILSAGEAQAGLDPTLPIKQAFQPTQEGINTVPTAYIYKIGDKRYGFPQRSDKYDGITSIVHTETEYYETTFQISVLATQDPKNTALYTASDIANRMAYILQSDYGVTALRAAGIGIYRVTEVRNPYFVDDRQRYEANPSFDFVLTHKQIITTTTPAAQSVRFQLIEV